MDFPIEFDECPVCHSKERIVETVVNAEIAAGKLKKDSVIPAFITRSAIFDPRDKSAIIARKIIDNLIGIYDVCAKCGTLYCVSMQKQAAVVEPNFKNIGKG